MLDHCLLVSYANCGRDLRIIANGQRVEDGASFVSVSADRPQ